MEYRSSVGFLGLPLVHVTTGTLVHGRFRRGVATAWFAVGDVAFGVLFACGGVAVGGVSLGGATFGLLPLGGVAVGVLAAGGLALGVVAVGGAALAWYAAVGGLAVARDYAIGGAAFARNVIVPLAAEPFPISAIPHPPLRWTDAVLLVAIVAVLLLVARSIRARRAQ
jgi:hypothetical protein